MSLTLPWLHLKIVQRHSFIEGKLHCVAGKGRDQFAGIWGLASTHMTFCAFCNNAKCTIYMGKGRDEIILRGHGPYAYFNE